MAFPESHKKTDSEGVEGDMGLGVKTVAVLLSLDQVLTSEEQADQWTIL